MGSSPRSLVGCPNFITQSIQAVQVIELGPHRALARPVRVGKHTVAPVSHADAARLGCLSSSRGLGFFHICEQKYRQEESVHL
jgi:hypothetical protein